MSEQAILMQRIAETALADWHEEQRVKRENGAVQVDASLRESVQNRIKFGRDKEDSE